MTDTSQNPQSKILRLLAELIPTVHAFVAESTTYLDKLSDDQYYNDHSNAAISQMMIRMAAIGRELIELQRKLT